MLRAQSVITQIIASQAAITATSTDTTVLQEFDCDSIVLELNVSQIAATTTTLDTYVQTQDSAGNWLDVCRFAAFTASSATKHYAIVPIMGGSGAVKGAVGSKTISASTLGVPILSRAIRTIGNLTGTDAVSFTLTAYFNQQSGRT